MDHYRTNGDWLIGFVEFLALLIILGPVMYWLLRNWGAIVVVLGSQP